MSRATPWVLQEVGRAVATQDGGRPRDYEDGPVHPEWPIERAEQRGYMDQARARGIVTWRDELRLLADEVLAEADPVALRAALLGLAAGATRWAESLDRRASASAELVQPHVSRPHHPEESR